MASNQTSYRTAVDVPPSPFERAVKQLLAEFTAWLAPRMQRAGRIVLAELLRAVIAAAALGFALVAAIYGTIYFFSFLVEVLGQWMPHWAALGVTSAIMLVPAGLAALVGLWQIFKMRSVRVAASAAVGAGTALRGFTRRNIPDAKGF